MTGEPPLIPLRLPERLRPTQDAHGLVGRVVRVDRGRALAMDDSGRAVEIPGSASAGAELCTGDWVTWTSGEVTRLERSSVIARASRARGEGQTVAVNVDVLFLVVRAEEATRERLLQRLAAIGWDSGARPVLVISAADRATDARRREIERVVIRSAPGVEWVMTSALSGEGIEELASMLGPTTTAALLGHSGAGKSTLINSIAGANVQQTGEVRARDVKGRHTTTSRELIDLGERGYVIDTPGVRELGVLDGHSVERTFTDVAALAQSCRFSDCRHESEPGCAVLAATESGELEPGRLDDYQRLRREADHAERKAGPARRDKGREYNRLSRQYRRARGH
ncbi:ribosome small subunit-dependent GTPase A [Bogoriella caseilytica]|uniref:Small ribosomal subunit biogenesis GTPase RsgA n=1 Tax=Bogoriella caseilytica TaxID=56055 RepID=A0A3N2BEK0_9MICO|nr:ribosome small subunit-dependent GTPase A [Bogoriella caseilytica]ROR73645.1 ribosome biogenesis GTPase [Bogoriella caseilytica]